MLNRDFREMLSAFIDAEAEFLVIGAYALAAHGIPRATGDLDFWVRPETSNAQRVLRALEHFGAPTDGVSVADLTSPDIVFQIGVEPTRIDILTTIDGVEFQEAWEAKEIADIDGFRVPLISVEHMIRNKRAVGRPRDLADVAALEEAEGRGG